jgi:hypothetical protein
MSDSNRSAAATGTPAPVTTGPAAVYLTQHRLTTSANWLRIHRGRGDGPDFFRDQDSGWCRYTQEALDAWIAKWMQKRVL